MFNPGDLAEHQHAAVGIPIDGRVSPGLTHCEAVAEEPTEQFDFEEAEQEEEIPFVPSVRVGNGDQHNSLNFQIYKLDKLSAIPSLKPFLCMNRTDNRWTEAVLMARPTPLSPPPLLIPLNPTTAWIATKII